MIDNNLPCAQTVIRSHVLAWFPGGRRSGDPAYSGWDLYRAEAWDNGGPMPPRFLTLRATLGADADELRVLVAHRLGRQALLGRSQFTVMVEPGFTQTFPCFDVYTLDGP